MFTNWISSKRFHSHKLQKCVCVCKIQQGELPAVALRVSLLLTAASGLDVSIKWVPSSLWSSGGTTGTPDPFDAMIKSAI